MIKDFLKLKNELSSMGGGGGGFALPLPIPGRRNKPSPRPRTRTRVPRGGRGKLGLGLLGLGLLGGGAMAAQKFIGGNEEKRQTATGISGEIVAKFDSVLQKFDEAVTNLESLISGSGEKGDGKDKKGGGGSGGFRSGVGNVDAATIKADTAEKKAFIATVREAEGTSGEQGYNTVYGGAVVPELTQMTLGELHEATKLGGTDRLPERLGGGVIPFKKDKHNSSASGALQLMPNTLMGLMNSDNFDKDTIFTPEVQNQMILQLAAERGIDVQNMDVSQMRKAGGIWAGLTPQYNQTTRTASDSMKLYDDNLIEARKTTSSPYSVPEGQMGPVIEPKPDKVSSLTPQSATYVSQVPGSNSVTIIPMGGGDSGPQERTSPPPPVQVGSSENHINFNLSPEDSDNIHPMHTKATLNIC
jgi:muramidase (phage lysozyme)